MLLRTLTTLALLLCLPGLSAQGSEMLRVTGSRLVPREAKPGAEVRLEVDVEIQPGYHVYGKKSGRPPSLTLSEARGLKPKGELQFPDGEPHEQMGITSYWVVGKATLSQVYLLPKSAQAGELEIKGAVAGDICNDAMCSQLQPQGFVAKLKVLAAVPAAAPAPAAPEAGAAQDPMAGIGTDPDFGGGSELIAELTFVPESARPGEVVEIRVSVMPPLGKHVYGAKQDGGMRTTLSLIGDGGTKPIGHSQLPDGEEHEGSYWLSDPFEIVQRVLVPEHTPAGQLHFYARLDFMVCDEYSCDPPGHKEFKVSLPVALGDVRKEYAPSAADLEILQGKAAAPEAVGDSGTHGSEEDKEKKDLWAFLLLAIGGGLFALAMPCTYPMIPITISFFTKQAENRGGKVLPLSITYGFGIVLIFILIGLTVGSAIIPFATHWSTNLLIGVVFFFFALSLFGIFNLQPPRFLMDVASKASMKGGFIGVFLMGATLVVTSFTCTAPFVGTLLAAGAKQGYARMTLGMAVFGLTMAIPFVILSMLPSKLKSMPRSGNWMNTLKVVLGFIEIAAALKFFSNAELDLKLHILPRELFLLLWFGIFLVAALFLFGIINLKGEAKEGIGPSRMAWGVVLLMFGFYNLFGALGNQLDWIMTAMAPPYSAEQLHARAVSAPVDLKYPKADRKHGGRHLVFIDDYDAARHAASLEGKLLLVNFTGHQ
ncbi:MAG: hypothetical protein CSA62_02665 [Planctomycetota bacterium]|nr:MAG: hypothetical protein CSA62_02665 [Planctomycetota bacterium]